MFPQEFDPLSNELLIFFCQKSQSYFPQFTDKLIRSFKDIKLFINQLRINVISSDNHISFYSSQNVTL